MVLLLVGEFRIGRPLKRMDFAPIRKEANNRFLYWIGYIFQQRDILSEYTFDNFTIIR